MKTNGESTYQEGWKAAWNGCDKKSNPYAEYSSNYSHWNDGWINAKMTECSTKPSGYEQN